MNIITAIRNNPPMAAPIIISIVSDCVSGVSVVKRSVRLKNVVSLPSVLKNHQAHPKAVDIKRNRDK
jgi:hypothetical protein